MFAFDVSWTSRNWDQTIPCVFSDARHLGIQLADHRTSIIAQARSVLHWICHNRFCAKCGWANDLVLAAIVSSAATRTVKSCFFRASTQQ